MNENQFIHRKIDHLAHAMNPLSQTEARSEFDLLDLVHDSLPDLNLNEVEIGNPFFVSGMTAGFDGAIAINQILAQACSEKGWLFGLGSQRRELDSKFLDQDSAQLHALYPQLKLVSNLGIAQLIEVDRDQLWNRLQDVLSRTGATYVAIHLNVLQESIQEEGTPNFKGGLQALQNLKKNISLPLILKETGSGMSRSFLSRVRELSPFAVDVSGTGGTHWGRIEGMRAESALHQNLGKTFENWGVGTLTSVANAKIVFEGTATEVWASGGVRSGLQAAKCLALGADRVGFAKPALENALQGAVRLHEFMSQIEKELKIALFCTNSKNTKELTKQKVEWRS